MAAADDIIQGNQDARDGKPLPTGPNKYYSWGYAEGKRHVVLQARVRTLEIRLGIPEPSEP